MTVKILIIETNLFFAEGLKYAISEYFTLKERSVEFLEKSENNVAADLIFIAQPELGNVAYCDRDVHEADTSPLYISIRKIKPVRAPRGSECARALGALDYYIGIDELFHLLDAKFWRMRVINSSAKPCFFCLSRRLSGREKEVVSYLRLGVNQTQTAKYMKLSVKTVHTYKQSVMRKLNFMRRSDLYSWLLRI